MINILGTLLAWQAAPMAIPQAVPMSTAQQPVTHPLLVATSPDARKGSTVATGRALVARADWISANFAPAPGSPSKAQVDSLRDQVKSDLDSIADMSEQDAMQLQMATDRLSNTLPVLAKILKKYDDAAKAIVQNMRN